MRKKAPVLIILAALLLGLMAQFTVSAFSDVDESVQQFEAITRLSELNIVSGYPDGTFKPGGNVTRAEFVKMLMSLSAINIELDPNAPTGFSDVDGKNYWAAPYIYLAVQQKIISGFGDGTFRPDDPVTIEQAIKMALCYLGYEPAAQARAQQAGQPVYPFGFMAIANEKMLTKNAAAPMGQPASRAIAAQILYNSISIPRMTQTGLKDGIPVYSSSSGGGGGGRSGGGGSSGSIINQDDLKGVVVAAYDLCIDSEVKQKYPKLGIQYFVVKDSSGKSVLMRDSSNKNPNKYKAYIGMKVQVYFPETTEDVKEVQSIKLTGDSMVITIDAKDINRDKSVKDPDNKLWYYDRVKDKQVSIKLPEDLSSMYVIYNGKLIEATPAPTVTPTPEVSPAPEATPNALPSSSPGVTQDETSTPSPEVTPTETSTPSPTTTPTPAPTPAALVTLDDLMPIEGSVTFIFTSGSGTPNVVKVESYETWFVSDIETLANHMYRITDKYRDRSITINGDSSGLTVYSGKEESGTKIDINRIRVWDVLLIAASKDSSVVKILANQQFNTGVIGQIDVEGNIYIGSSKDPLNQSYYYTQYFKPANDLDLQPQDLIKYYTDVNNNLVAIIKNPPNLTFAYLIDAGERTDINKGAYLGLRVFPSPSGSNELQCKSVKILNPATGKYEGVSFATALSRLEANAKPINDAKPADVKDDNAKYAQLIQYEYNYSNQQISIKLLSPGVMFSDGDAPRRVTGNKISGLISSLSGLSIFYVPNDRFETEKYKTLSSLSDGLYNVEVYNRQELDSNNETYERPGAIIVYNESLDKNPSVYSKAMIVNSISSRSDGNAVVFSYTGNVLGYGYSTENSVNKVEGRKVTDSDNSGSIYVVDKGDVIWYGKTYEGNNSYIATAKLLFDADSDKNTRYYLPYNIYSKLAPNDTNPYMTFICGDAKSLPQYQDDFIGLDIDGDGKYTPNSADVSVQMTSTVYLYDLCQGSPQVTTLSSYRDINRNDKVIAILKNDGNFGMYTAMLYVVRYPAE